MSDNLEIERRFLLKRMPQVEYESVSLITQIYVEEGEDTVRYRGERNATEQKFTRTIKRDLEGTLVREEIEEETTQEEFIKKAQLSNKIITKRRNVFPVGDLKWEVDNFTLFDMIIAEVELPSKDYDLDIPQSIRETMVMEVTNMSEFNNYALADNYEKV